MSVRILAAINHHLFPLRGWQWLLFPLSWLYGKGMSLRRWCYRKEIFPRVSLPGKVISVGNLSVGGVGKTPLVRAIAQRLVEKGASPAILTRGYGSFLGHRGVAFLLEGKLLRSNTLLKDLGADEAMMLSHQLPFVPVVVGRNRVQAAQFFLDHYSNPITHWILDDGFQHLKIRRSVDLVLLDGISPFENGVALPAGRLRELPVSLQDASKVIVVDKGVGVVQYVEGAFYSIYKLLHPYNPQTRDLLDLTKSLKLLGVSGIGKPSDFFVGLQKLNVCVSKKMILPDHSPISRSLLDWHREGLDGVVTTAKDYWRDPKVFDQIPVWITDLSVCVDFLEDLSI